MDAVDALKRAQPDAVRFDGERVGLEVRDPGLINGHQTLNKAIGVNSRNQACEVYP